MDRDPYLQIIKACQRHDVKRIDKLCKDILQEHNVNLQDYYKQMGLIKNQITEDDHVRLRQLYRQRTELTKQIQELSRKIAESYRSFYTEMSPLEESWRSDTAAAPPRDKE